MRCIARLRFARSIAIGLISARPQPRKGSQSNSRLMTYTCGGNTEVNAMVSHADWCFDKITHGSRGIFSRPRTS